jgi:haloalkane dehalogenase
MLAPNPFKMSPAVKALYPFEVREFPTVDGVMRFVDYGPKEGPAVLLVHGNPSWSFLWRNLALRLGLVGFRVIVPDHLGMGLSDRPEKFLRLEDRIRTLQGLVDFLGIKKFDIGVHDWGGAIGLALAGRMPERVGKILITNTGAFLSDNIPKRIALCRLPWIGRFMVEKFNAFAWPATWMAVQKPMKPEVKEGFLYPYHSSDSRKAVADFVADIPMELNHPTRPVLDQGRSESQFAERKARHDFMGLKRFLL